jgi:hypothetical protein
MTLLELARQQGKAKVAIAARIDGFLQDLAAQAPPDGKVEWVMPEDPDGIEIMRHSSAHVMAAAVKELFPEAKGSITISTWRIRLRRKTSNGLRKRWGRS